MVHSPYRWFWVAGIVLLLYLQSAALYPAGGTAVHVIEQDRHDLADVPPYPPTGAPALFDGQTRLGPREASLALGNAHTCILMDGSVQCWGDNQEGQADGYGAGDAKQISAGNRHTCVLQYSGNIHCWGADVDGQSEPYLGGDAIQVAGGGAHTCGLLRDGNVACWGNNDAGQADGYGGEDAVFVVAGGEHSCALVDSGEVTCWGALQLNHTEQDVVGLSSGRDHVCMLLQSGSVNCRGPIPTTMSHLESSTTSSGGYQVRSLPGGPGGTRCTTVPSQAAQAAPVVPPGVGFCEGSHRAIQVAAGGHHSCVLLETGNTYCWGHNHMGQSEPHRHAKVAQLEAGGDHTCILLTFKAVRCWGNNDHGQATAFRIKQSHVGVGERHICVWSQGSVDCWGSNAYGQAEPYEEGDAVELSVGRNHNCVLKVSGEVHCWGAGKLIEGGDPHHGQSRGYDGRDAIQVSAGTRYSCAVLLDGAAECWGGYLDHNQDHGYVRTASTDGGPTVRCFGMLYVSEWGNAQSGCVGDVHAIKAVTHGGSPCFLLENGHVYCVSALMEDGAQDTDGDVLNLAQGDAFRCFLRTTGNVDCKGELQEGYEGRDAVEVVAGDNHACALLFGGNVTCWGTSEFGEVLDYKESDAVQVTAGPQTTCILRGPDVECWGSIQGNFSVQSPEPRTDPVRVEDGGNTAGNLEYLWESVWLLVIGPFVLLSLLVLAVIRLRTRAPAPAKASHDPFVLESGRLFLSKYMIERELGRGAFGTVWLATHARLERYVVIKQLHPEWSRRVETRKRFEREAKILATLDHPNVTRIFDVEEAAGSWFLVMEYVEGGSLQERLDGLDPATDAGSSDAGTLLDPPASPRKGMPETEATRIILDVLSGLSCIHARSVLHRDLKPANILLTRAGNAKIADFGVSRSHAQEVTNLTQASSPPGTPLFMAPEQLAKGKSDDRSDLYATAATFYRMLTGRSYIGDTPVTLGELHRRILEDSPVLPIAGISPGLNEWLAKGLTKQPEARFQSAEEAMRALRTVDLPR